MSKVYVIDANIFISAHREKFPLDVVPSFWAKIKSLAEAGKLISLDKVKEEIYRMEDELAGWCKEHLPDEFWYASESAAGEYAGLARWAYGQTRIYNPEAIAEFLEGDNADAFLIAYAMADKDNRILVTYETSGNGSKKRVKIPDVCVAFGVKLMVPNQMFRDLGEKI